jgi:hypothetical protein
MEYYEIPPPERDATPPRRSEKQWTFTGLFAVLGFVVGGGYVFLAGYYQFSPGPRPPGTGGCGLAAIGGLIVMFMGAPIIGLILALVAACVGYYVDLARHDL